MRSRCVLFALACSSLGLAVLAGEGVSWTKQREIVLPGGAFSDLMCVDEGASRLYVAHSPYVDVVDLVKGERIGRVPGVKAAHGVAVVPEAKRGFATSGGNDTLVVFDLDSLDVVKQIATGAYPDEVLHVASAKEVWSFNGDAETVTCVDPASLAVTATITLPGACELAVEDAAAGVVYVNIADKGLVCSIDARKHRVLGTFGVSPGEEPTGLALDAANDLLFVGCGNRKLVVVTTEGRGVATLDIGDGCDGVIFDQKTKTVFASCQDGTSVVAEKDARTFEVLGTLDTPSGGACVLDGKRRELIVDTAPPEGEPGDVKLLVFTQ